MGLDTGEVVQYRWDALARLDTVIDPEGDRTRFQYDAAGLRQRVDYGNRTSASYAYDAAGQVRSIVYANAASEVQSAFGYEYDAAGNRKHKRFMDGSEERYGYDGLDRLMAVDYPAGRHVDYGYDAVGNRTSLVDSVVQVDRWPASATASSGPTAGVVGTANGYYWQPDVASANPHWVEVTYAAAERAAGVKVRKVFGAPSVVRVDLIEGNGASHTVYEGGDRTTDGGWLTVPFPTTAYAVKKVRVWTVKAAGAETSERIDAVGLVAVKAETYQYNAFNQLTGVTGNDGSSKAFGYDDNGNQVSKTDGSGLTQYVYNLDNRLVGIALPSGVSNAFEYDANGLRTKKTDSGGTTAYLLDGMSVVAQYGTDGARQAWYTQSLARIDEVLSVVNAQGKFWYEADALGSVYTLTTAAGDVRARGGYDVSGEPVAEYGQTVGQPFGFTGREHELDSGLVYARARYLNPAVGAWTAADPLTQAISLNGGYKAEPFLMRVGAGADIPAAGSSRYLYANASPTLGTDPSGLWVLYTGFGGTAAAGVGMTYGVGGVFGYGSGGFSSALALTAGFAVQLGPTLANLVNISVTVEFGLYWGLDNACEYGGPFISLAADFGEVGASVVWSVTWSALRSLRTTHGMADLAAALGQPVGMSFSFNFLPLKLPTSGVTLTGTYSGLLGPVGCKCM
jgi:RHS repeat-associated protein